MTRVRRAAIAVGVVLGLLGGLSGAATASVRPATTENVAGGPEAVSCPTSNWCAAVGTVQTAVVHHEEVLKPVAWILAGGHWTRQMLPMPPGTAAVPEAYIGSVSCPAAGACVAVGSFYLPGRVTRVKLYAETLADGRWTVRTMGLPAGSKTSAFAVQGEGPSVACVLLTTCTVVWSVDEPDFVFATPAVWQLRGTTWTATALPSPPGTTAGNRIAMLQGVSCADATHCTAVGYHEDSAHNMVPLIETYADGHWVAHDGLVPLAESAYLMSVDCPAVNACEAVGFAEPDPKSGMTYPVVVTGRAGTWKLRRLSLAAGGTSAAFGSVSCAAVRACVAVGWSGKRALKPFAARLAAGAWRSEVPAGRIPLNNVSCGGVSRCVATTGLAVPARDRIDTLTPSGWSSRSVGLPA